MILFEKRHGKYVKQWQEFLRSQGAEIAVDGVFGPKTVAATKAYQQANDLLPDGIVGPKTMERARGAGWALATAHKVHPIDPHGPPKPGFGHLSDEQRDELFGRFDYVPYPGPRDSDSG